MPRVDVWDVQAAVPEPAPTLGLPRGLEERYLLGRTLGRGGFGLVRAATSVATGLEYACKSIAKSLDLPDVSLAKRAQHLEGIRREIAVLRRLRGTLNVVTLEEARAPRRTPAPPHATAARQPASSSSRPAAAG
jgi:calcium-dependent protein kinase